METILACRRCLTSKPASDFHKSNQRACGYALWCKLCAAAYNRERRRRPDVHARVLASDRARYRAKHPPRHVDWDVAFAGIPTLEWVRLAAFIDGEGTITTGFSARTSANVHRTIQVMIANTDRRLTDWLQRTFRGPVRFVPAKSPRHRPSYCWSIVARHAEAVLQRCLPHLLLKRRHAELAIEYRRTFHLNGGLAIPAKVITRRQELGAMITDLNRRGAR